MTTLVLSTPIAGRAAQQCGVSNGVSICLNVPGGILSGDVPISASTSGSLSGVSAVIFYWGTTSTSTTHLLQDFQAPYQFTWRTDQYLDATQYVVARVQKNSSTLGSPISIQASISNGNLASVPMNPDDWTTLFQPRPSVGDPLIAAVGDAGDGTANSAATAASILGSEASILLFLGDMYERGTPAEWDYNFGRASFDPRAGASAWGSLASFTRPTLGNHEAHDVSTWRNYWHGRPDWETFVFGGVRFFNLNSECSAFGCSSSSAQYRFVQSVLAANTYPCVVAFWHRPALSAVEDSTRIRPIWSLLADNGGDLVLNGHTHTMQRYQPLNANLQVGQPDSHMVEVVSGAGAHNQTATVDSDPRNAWQVTKVPATMYLTPVGGGSGQAHRIDWLFRDNNGNVVTGSRSSVDCGGSPDTNPPTVPSQPAGVSSASGSIDLTWAASVDDVAGTLAYDIYRDFGSTAIATVMSSSTTTVLYTDVGLAGGSTHTYQVSASDGVNSSARSLASDPITVQDGAVPIFVDGFDSAFAGWTSTVGLTLDATRGSPAAPSALAQLSNGPGYATKVLGATFGSLCASERVNLTSVGTSGASLLRLRTTTDGPIIRVSVKSNRSLWLRSDFSGVQKAVSAKLPLDSWSKIELCGTVGSVGAWTLFVNGISVVGPWTADTGATPIGRVVIGTQDARTITVRFDDMRVDLSPGDA